jgi:blue copper oxidase
MKRRDFVSMLSASAGASLLLGCRKELIMQPGEVAEEDALFAARGGGGGGTLTRFPLKIPAVVSPSNHTLIARTANTNIGGSSMSNVWTYNGDYPASTIKAFRGDTVNIQLVNQLPEETITHWHGMIVDHMNDGGPMHTIPTGGSYQYNYTINQRAALNWYHPHPHMKTGKQVNLGMAGAFIINDAEEAAHNLPSGSFEIPLIIRDATLDKNGNLTYKPTSGGFNGTIPMVNGTRSPYLDVQRAVYRFRILNGANSRIFGLALGNGAAVKLIGNDGGLLATMTDETRMDISPGERLDILVDFRSYATGSKIMLRDLRAGWDLLEFRVTGSTVVPYTFPSPNLSVITPLNNPVRTRIFSFDGMTKINGKEYDMNRIDWEVPFGETELWRFITNGNAPHPVHIHGASFQVVRRTGGRARLYPWEMGWKDTVLLEDFETVDVLIRFDSPVNKMPGMDNLYVMHCHKLEHEDLGMMANFRII